MKLETGGAIEMNTIKLMRRSYIMYVMKYANFEEFEQSDEYKLGKPVQVKFADGTGYERDEYGTQFWYKDGKLHRDGNLPATIYARGTQFWYKNGVNYTPKKQYANFEEFEQSDEYKLGKPVQVKFPDGTSYEKDSNGDQWWCKDGNLHRDGDLPAVIWAIGGQFWYKNGEPHRNGDLPAIIYANGDQYWYKNGKLHRDEDLPAVILARGDQYWYKDGVQYTPKKQYANFAEFEQSKKYKKGKPVEVKFADGTSYERNTFGTQFWYKDGQQHRDGDLPAVIYATGDQLWYKNGKLHRDGDLPAAIYADGSQFYYKNSMYYTPEIQISENQEVVDNIINNFQFDRVEKVMKALNWEWIDVGIPSIEQLREKARSLLIEAKRYVSTSTKFEPEYHVSVCGFTVDAHKVGNSDKVYLRLAFEVDEWDNYE
jgi:ribosomal protein L25 (general stress protein Ctc)